MTDVWGCRRVIVGIILASATAMFGATTASAQTDLDGRYQVEEHDEGAGGAGAINTCPTPWTKEPNKSPSRDDGIVKVTTAGNTVLFAREDNTVLLSATLSTEDDTFQGQNGTDGQGSMRVQNSSFGPQAKFESNGLTETFKIIQPHVNVGTNDECWQVEIRGQRLSGGDATTIATAAPQTPTPPARKGGGSKTGILIGAGALGAAGIAVVARRRRKGPTDCAGLRAQYDQLLSSYQANEARLRNALENLAAPQGNLAQNLITARALEEKRNEALGYLAAAAIAGVVALGAEAAAAAQAAAAQAAAAEAAETIAWATANAAAHAKDLEIMWAMYRSHLAAAAAL
jgi:hypothetical protein